jgi:hypothetical protein
MATQLLTSLAEIYRYTPCHSGWKNIVLAQFPFDSARADSDPKTSTRQFSISAALESNSVCDICWLIGKRKNVREIKMLAVFARDCADCASQYLSGEAAAYAAEAAAYADVAAAYAYAAYAAAAYAAYAAYAAAAANAAAAAAEADAYAAEADASQKIKNKAFLLARIRELEETL